MNVGDLAYGVVASPAGPRAVARVSGRLVDLAVLDADLFDEGSLDTFLAAGPDVWSRVHEEVVGAPEVHLDADDVVLPFTVADYVDFYASEHHATNVGRLFRPDGDPLTPNWKHLPIGYHGRAGTVVVSGTGVRRPSGQFLDADGAVGFGPSRRLDLEAEVAFVVGVPSEPGVPVPTNAFAEHVFGVCLLNDWSARDLQSWEYRPLGPFLGKSFATSVSAWITPLAALDAAWTDPPAQDPTPLPYLAGIGSQGLDLDLTVSINGTVVSSPSFAAMYWTPAQLVAHLTSNGARLRTGDLLASGTVSDADQPGCLLELTAGGAEPVALGDGSVRTFLEDGDEVVLTATAPSATGTPIALGEVRGRVLPAAAGVRYGR